MSKFSPTPTYSRQYVTTIWRIGRCERPRFLTLFDHITSFAIPIFIDVGLIVASNNLIVGAKPLLFVLLLGI